jgi:hypothetical protein
MLVLNRTSRVSQRDQKGGTAMTPSSLQQSARESLDGTGAGDHDMPCVFGRSPRALAPFPLSLHQLARLMVLRSRDRSALDHLDERVQQT